MSGASLWLEAEAAGGAPPRVAATATSPATAATSTRPRAAALRALALAFCDRLRRLRVERCRDARRTALLGKAVDDNGALYAAEGDLDAVGDVDLLRRLHALAVQMDAAAEHGFRREAA